LKNFNSAENEEDRQQNFFGEKAKDVLIAESFLTNFIIEFSDVLLLVVDNLTYSEQKVKNYINNILLKNGTFSLNKHEHISSEENEIKGEHFTEPEKKFFRVYHLIFAADKSEAGKIYNAYTM
jgi:hypothetical protein